MKPWIYLAVLLVIGVAIIISGCTSNVQAVEKEKPLFVIDEQPCSEFISINAVPAESDNRESLTAGLREVEKTHKVIRWESKQTSTYGGYNPTSGYDVQVELNESCRQ